MCAAWGRLSQDMKEAEAVLDSVLAEGERMTSGLSRRASSLDSDRAASRCYDADSWDRSRRVRCHSRMPQSDATLYWDNSRMPRGSPALGDRCGQLDTSDQLLADRERMRAARKRATKGKQPLSSASSTRSRRASEGSHGGLQVLAGLNLSASLCLVGLCCFVALHLRQCLPVCVCTCHRSLCPCGAWVSSFLYACICTMNTAVMPVF